MQCEFVCRSNLSILEYRSRSVSPSPSDCLDLCAWLAASSSASSATVWGSTPFMLHRRFNSPLSSDCFSARCLRQLIADCSYDAAPAADNGGATFDSVRLAISSDAPRV